MTTDRQVILTQNFPGCCILEPFNYRIWIPEVNSRSKIRYSCNFVGVLYQLQVSSSQASRTIQAYLAVTSVMSYSPYMYCQPWCLKTTSPAIAKLPFMQLLYKARWIDSTLIDITQILLLTVLFTHAIELGCCIVQYLSTMLSLIKALC